MTAEQLRAIEYCRKSEDAEDRQVQSIESQQRILAPLREDWNLVVVKPFEEEQTAKKPGRPRFNEMVTMIEQGEADAIVCWKPNRLARNPIDGGKILWLLQTSKLKAIITPYRTYLPTDNMIPLAVEFAMANQQSIDLGVDVKVGLDSKVEKGWRPNQAPLGYLNDPHGEKGEKQIFVDKDRFPLVRKMWDLLLSGNYKSKQIRAIANEEWGLKTKRGNKLAESSIYAVFHNRFYTGFFERNGELIKGQHKAMITLQEYERVQLLLGKKGKPAPHSYVQAYTGEIWCAECGSQVTVDPKRHCVCTKCSYKFSCRQQTACPECDTDISEMTNPVIRDYLIYRCTKKKGRCGQPGINVKELEQQIDAHLATLYLDPEYLHWAIRHLKRAHRLESAKREAIQQSQQAAYNEATRKLDGLLDMRLNKEISEEEYKAKKQQLIHEQAALEAQLKEIKERQHRWLELSERTFNFAAYARFWFASAELEGDLQKKREILTTLGTNLILKDGILRVEMPEPFKILQEALVTIPEAKATKNPTPEPVKTPVFSNERTKEAIAKPVRPEWSGI